MTRPTSRRRPTRFDLVRTIAEKRLKNRRLTVIDATNVRAADRKDWVALARRWHALPVAIVLDPGIDLCIERNKARPDRPFGPAVVVRMVSEIRRGLGGLQREGFRQVWRLGTAEGIDAATVERRPLWTDKRDDSGPSTSSATSMAAPTSSRRCCAAWATASTGRRRRAAARSR